VVVLGKVLARGQVTLPRAIRRAAGLQPGDQVIFRATGPGKVELTVLPRLTLEEALERYRIEGPIDDAADREEWQDVAARDVLGSQDG
jgi:AbrB family looped-hinge helix DNA binding protein